MSKTRRDLFFESTQDAVFLLQNERIIEKNQSAKDLLRSYKVMIERIVEIANGKGCILHSTKEKCLDCDIRDAVDPKAFLFLLQRKDTGEEEQFSGCYSILDENHQSLVIRPIIETSKLQQMIQKKQLVKYVTEAHEKERKMIAQELHDGIAQSIFSLMLELRQLKVLADQEAVIAQVEKMDGHFSEVLREIKQMAIDLRPTALDDLGLLPALKILLHRMEETTGIQIQFHAEISKDFSFSDAASTVIYRVVQESLTNCVKYAGVQEVFIWLVEEDQQLKIVILDHGKGFDLAHLDKTRQGLGLLNMQERAEMIGGSFHIDSQINEGTKIVLMIPMIREGIET